MGEFEFIAAYLAKLAGAEALDLKDDVALWTPPHGQDVVLSMDTLVEGVHFPTGQFDAKLAQKLLRVNISDIVAKGATPIGYLLSLCLSETIDETALQSFCKGLELDQAKYGLQLWGGDTTRTTGICVLNLTIIGTVPQGQTVQRSTASVGDVVCVTGTIGDAYLGLQTVLGALKPDAELRCAYDLPDPPYELRNEIQKYASAALDISDGLIADAAHLAKASAVALQLDLSTMPISPSAHNWVEAQAEETKAWIVLATGGDDYQTLMTLSASAYKQAMRVNMPITKIGLVVEGLGVTCHDGRGHELVIDKAGYTHF